jgi:hypothetical protein
MQTMKNPSAKIMRWLITLSDYNMTIQHSPGRHIAHADSLSRFIHKIDHDTITSTFTIETLKNEQIQDQDCKKLRHKVNFFFQDDILYKKTAHGNRIVLPLSLRPIVLSQYHGSILSGHAGKHKVNVKIAEQYWWPSRRQYIFNFIKSCIKCAQHDSSPKTENNI